MERQRGLATRKMSFRPSVRLSIYLSVKLVICDRTRESWANILVRNKKNGWWGDIFYPKFWVKLAPLERKRQFSTDIRS